jgi:hypothetical protein
MLMTFLLLVICLVFYFCLIWFSEECDLRGCRSKVVCKGLVDERINLYGMGIVFRGGINMNRVIE